MQKNIQEYIIHEEKDLDEIVFDLVPWDRIFFSWDLGAGKSTFIRHLIRSQLGDPKLIVRSPTYTYYQKYGNIIHCDLYRLEDHDTWISIGGDEIARDPTSILLIEWPEIIAHDISPTKKIHIDILSDTERRVNIENCV